MTERETMLGFWRPETDPADPHVWNGITLSKHETQQKPNRTHNKEQNRTNRGGLRPPVFCFEPFGKRVGE